MRSAFQDEEDQEIGQPGAQPAVEENLRPDSGTEASPDLSSDRELTISATTLLAIFFGLVLLCGLFFGLGYTFGRRSSSDLTAAQLPAAQAQSASLSFSNQPKPTAAAQSVSTVPTPSQPQPDSSATAPPDGAPPDDTPPSEPEAKAVNQKPSEPVSTPAATPAATQAGTMVQIAAISNPADADVLVRALQQHGYSASAHRFPPDPLIHVQIGPFANRADAVAMKQKLLSDGYNAILK